MVRLRHTFGLVHRMRSALFFVLATLAHAGALAQEAPPPVRTFTPFSAATAVDTPAVERSEGTILVEVDPDITRTMERYGEGTLPRTGYRVQIFLGDRKTAEETKRSFLQRNPEVPAYLSWLAPNFRLRVGDLNTRLEAEHLLQELKATFPGSYIVPDEIGMRWLPGE